MRARRAAASISGRSAISPSSRMSATRMRGFSDAYGSWKMIWMLRRASTSASPSRLNRSSLSSSARPSISAWRRSSCTIALPVVVLPQPDSPTSASVRAAPMVNDTSCDCREEAVRALQQAAADREAHAQVLHVEQRPAARRRRFGRLAANAGSGAGGGVLTAGVELRVVEQAAHAACRIDVEQRRRRVGRNAASPGRSAA